MLKSHQNVQTVFQKKKCNFHPKCQQTMNKTCLKFLGRILATKILNEVIYIGILQGCYNTSFLSTFKSKNKITFY